LDQDPPTSISPVTGITDVNHHAQCTAPFLMQNLFVFFSPLLDTQVVTKLFLLYA
jgi:hypothetical protein